MNWFSKNFEKKYDDCNINLQKRIMQIYMIYGPEASKLFDLDNFLIGCLSKYLDPHDVQVWNRSILEKYNFICEYLIYHGMDPFNKKTQEKAIRFIVHQINKNIILILQSTFDPNKAFDQYGDAGLFSIFKKIDKLNTRHYYISSLSDIKKIMDKIYLFFKYIDRLKILNIKKIVN
jgi:hypothetical protein